MIELNKKNSTEVHFLIEPDGNAPKKYGENVYRFSDFAVIKMLINRKWSVLKKQKNYAYLQCQSKIPIPFLLETKIPSKQTVIELAESYYIKKENVLDFIGEWPFSYEHDRNNDIIEHAYDLETKEVKKIRHRGELFSQLFIGTFLWHIDLRIKNGEISYDENDRNILEIYNESSFIEYDLFEGKKYNLGLSKYERNKLARIECIKHYGAYCQICGFNFREKYGDVGEGMIHVHHLKPISQIRKEYKVDPIIDLIPICPNCHLLIHSRYPIYSIEEIRELITK
jgi:hypothetical protein